MNMVKVFITVELEGEEILQDKMPREAYLRLFDTVDMFRKEGIPVQYKETNLPRYKPRFIRASELTEIDNIE